jgi:hypothetical protein
VASGYERGDCRPEPTIQDGGTDLKNPMCATRGPAHLSAFIHPSVELAYREASTMAYADAFRTIMVALLITTPLALLLRKVGAPQAPSTDA